MNPFALFLSLFLVIFGIICLESKEEKSHCDDILPDGYGFMVTGEFNTGTNHQAKTYIIHIIDPKTWIGNEYFTGDGFSANKADVKSVTESDSCELKYEYYLWATKIKP